MVRPSNEQAWNQEVVKKCYILHIFSTLIFVPKIRSIGVFKTGCLTAHFHNASIKEKIIIKIKHEENLKCQMSFVLALSESTSSF